MLADVSGALEGVDLPVEILVAEHDQVEREAVLRPLFSRLLSGAAITVVPGAGHLLPLEAPAAVAAACERILSAAA